jgi:hypothetical protein
MRKVFQDGCGLATADASVQKSGAGGSMARYFLL